MVHLLLSEQEIGVFWQYFEQVVPRQLSVVQRLLSLQLRMDPTLLIVAPTSSEEVRVAKAADPTLADATATVIGDVPDIFEQVMLKSSLMTVVEEAPSFVN